MDDEREEGWREDAPNPTQERMGEGEPRPADVSWGEDSWGDTEPAPHEGEEGTEPAA